MGLKYTLPYQKHWIKLLLSLALLSCSVAKESIGNESSSSNQEGKSSTQARSSASSAYTPDSELAAAFANQQSNFQVLVRAKVTRILADDNDGDRHQRFIITLGNKQTLLIAHNIDLAPRVEPLAVGDFVIVYGEYEWNDEGGVIHWTHKDPDNVHVEGWIRVE